MKVRKLKKQETRALMPTRGNGFPGVFAVGATAVVIAVMMILAATPGLAEIVEGWGDAELIETNDVWASTAQVAMNGDGNAIAVWVQEAAFEYSIWSNRYVVGDGWSDAQFIGSGQRIMPIPQVAMDGVGNAIAVWCQYDGTRNNVWSNRYVVGVGWGEEQLIDTDDGNVYYPQVAMDEVGNAIVIWDQHDGTQFSIYSNRYVIGDGWGGAELVETDDGSAYSPQVVMGRDGSAVAVWSQLDGTQFSIYSNRYVIGDGWGDADPIETDDGNVYSPQVAMDGEGNAIAVWNQHDGTQFSIYSNRYVVGDGWGGAELIETNDLDAHSPQVSVNGDGDAVAVWRQSEGTRDNIYSNRYALGVGWGDAELIETGDGYVISPQVAMDEVGNAIVIWDQHDGTQFSIYSNRYVVGDGWGGAELVETDDGSACSPQVAMDGEGNAIAVWHQYEGVSTSIFSNRYVNLVDHYQHRHCTGSPDVGAATL